MQVTKKNDKKVSGLTQVIGAVAGLALLLGASSSMAHETRFIDSDGFTLRMTVGNAVEPPFEDGDNKTDLFLRYKLDEGGDATDSYEDLDTGAPDSKASIDDLKIYVLMLKDDVRADDPDFQVREKKRLENVELGRGETARYQSQIRYSADGPIAYRFEGSVTTNDGDVIPVEETYFVCGGGTKTPGHAFSCVTDHPFVFPGEKHDGRKKDKASYKDDDKYSLKKDD